MRNNLIITFAICCGLALFTSCDRPECTNTNPVFDNFSPESKEYKDELVRQLKIIDKDDLRCFFDKYLEDDSLRYLQVLIQSADLCAMAVITVRNSDEQIKGIIEAKGQGYSGAEFIKLEFVALQDLLRTEFRYMGVNRLKN
ncbi:MAG: hypothetical protein KKA07_06740 [Bacteroidetes bacterium]|nr:hypothetical protein [Bacteroidota bacterium]MBU1718754.1 hypothetical protein [Bacteroidota bacterium]